MTNFIRTVRYFSIATIVFASIGQASQQQSDDSESVTPNKAVGERILRELDQIDRAWKLMSARSISLAHLSYKKAKDSSDLQKMSEADLRNSLCVGAAFDSGVQVGAIQGLHLGDDALLLKLPPSTDIRERLIYHDRIINAIASKMDQLAMFCAFTPDKLVKNDMITLIVSLDEPTMTLKTKTIGLKNDLRSLLNLNP